MPTHSLLSFVESPDTVTQDILIGHSAKMPDIVSSMTPHGPCLERAIVTAVDQLICCMFCEKTFDHQDDLGPHVLEQHPTTFPEPAVLRVEAEFRIPGERNLPKPIITVEREQVHSCIVCKQVFQDAPELENHMRKHKDYFYYCCNVCGRRFREPWFLKAHMKMHTKSGKSKAAQEFDAPTTINGITQEISESPVTLYKMCMVCGFFFPDHDSLASHSKIHNREADFHDRDGENLKVKEEERPKQTFIHGLNLQPSGEKATLLPVRTSKWIAQLDPFNTYQAWQLATKGKIAVGPNNIKDIGQEASTDNEENTSDREELNGVSTEGPAAASKDVRPPAPAITGPTQRPRRSLIQKDKNKERPTTCEDCQKTFRTYHQLVLHSRIHKRDRPGGESPTSGLELKPSLSGAVEPEEEEGLITEEGPLTDILASAEEGFERTKGRSKECTYCGKSFRSSYYLTVHLRTHTGEKPYKCTYCDYAAAQKTSLKYHLDRRHKEKPYMELPIRPSSSSSASLPSPPDLKMEQDSENSSSPTKMWIQDSKPYPTEAKCIPSVLVTDSKPLNYRDFVKCAAELHMPVNLKTEKQEIKDENYDDTPLNLSLKVSLSISAAPRKVSIPIACQQCPYKTIYPEVLAIHKKLAHKEKSDHVRRSAVSLQKRHTGCPPALDGKDVTPLPILVRSYPRRTKSPTPVPGKTQEKKMAKQSQNESQKCRQNVELQGNGQDVRFTEVMRKPSAGGVKYLLDIPDRVGTVERSYPVRTSVIWKTDAPHMCLSSRFGKLPHLDLGEPSNKRPKYNGAREGDAVEMAMGFRSAGEMPSLSMMSGRASLPGSSIQDALGAVSSSSVALGGALDAEWGNMNLLRSCTLNDLASLYHTSPGNPPRIGGRTVLYQHLPTLQNLPRIESSAQFPYQRYGNADKSA